MLLYRCVKGDVMAYYLTIRKKDTYIPIDIECLDCFTKLSKYKSGGYSLEEIDRCTMSYINEYFFKEDLYKAGLIELEDIARELTIRYKKSNSYELVRNGIPYRRTKNYFDLYGLKFILLSKQKDYIFLEKLVSYYRNSYMNNINVSKIKYCMEFGKRELLNVTLGEFYMREVTKYDSTTGEVKINYKYFHDLAMFIYNYDITLEKKQLGITKEEDKLERELTFEYLKKSLSGDLVEPKKKVKTKDLEGQISIF